MEFGGRYAFAAPRLAVWEALNDTGILKSVIPGCEKIDWTGPDAHEFPVVTEVRHNRLVMTDPAILARVQGSVPSLAEGDEWGVLLINGWLLRAQGAPSTPYAHDMDGRAYFAEVIVRVHWSPAN